MAISKENKSSWIHERRVKELIRRGYDVGNVHAMMAGNSKDFTLNQIEKMAKHEVRPNEMPLDGKL